MQMTKKAPTLAKAAMFALLGSALPSTLLAHGAVEVDNAPEHIIQASISQSAAIPGLSAVILDAPQPGILVSYRGSNVLTVEDTQGQGLLRFSPEGVMANRSSADWPGLSEARPGMVSSRNKDSSWVKVSATPSFGWLDPRLGVEDGERLWRIPVMTDSGAQSEIKGRLTRNPLPKDDHH
ncbi:MULTISPECIES: hypothetical protein [unclassified Marinobacter]|uniref:hypothetical protein n=1 Tax=unclassified Marinobacter TaxID=83889 RepID=UPI001268DCD8|nr:MULTISPECIES: hypothetical protein [unclassified Marinobacter]QFS85572.1 hypothetical protein FIV08_01795 [Marinobacter sp. THAF197a]QFT49366.1 hypothetical protein FIU96_01795 [Marinobacter sp. THAF39]